MVNYHIIIFVIILLLIISIINNVWLVNNIPITDSNIKINYLNNINPNKYQNINIKTYSYIYPKNIIVDKCYSTDCDINANLISEKIKTFHNELYTLTNNKLLILDNEYNIAPVTINNDDLKIISMINK